MEENNLAQASFFDIQISESVSLSLNKAARWAKLLAIFTTAFVVLFVLVMVISLRDANRINQPVIMIIMVSALILAVLVVAGLIALLFGFSNKIKNGLRTFDTALLERGTALLKLYFIITGIVYMLALLAVVTGLVVRIVNN